MAPTSTTSNYGSLGDTAYLPVAARGPKVLTGAPVWVMFEVEGASDEQNRD